MEEGEKEAREGLSGSDLPPPLWTRAWRLRGGRPAWLPWLPRHEDEEETTTGTTVAWGSVATAALEGTTATIGGGVSLT